jgi:nitroreductase
MLQSFKGLLSKRYTATSFATNKPIPDDMIQDLLSMTISAPTSFNLQPYNIVLVKSEEKRTLLAEEAMMGGNRTRVLEAPVTAVFASFRDPAKRIPAFQSLLKSHNVSSSYRKAQSAKMNFLLNNSGGLSSALKQIGTHLASPLQPSPVLPSPNSWSQKNTAFAAQTFILAATASGLNSAAMEGFDERRVCSILDIPQQEFSIPVMVSIGYPAANEKQKDRIRFSIEDMYHVDTFKR